MLRGLKRLARTAVEAQGYYVRPTSQYGLSLGDDVRRLLRVKDQLQIVDVGANAGQWLASLKPAFPSARIICYEPDERAFALLQETARQFSAVDCVQCALGNEAGATTFFRNADSVTSSLLRPAARAKPLPYGEKLVAFDSVDMEVRTLSGEMRRLGIDHIDLLKTDCQGFDLRVLEGAAQEIERGAIDLISTEALFHPEYDGEAWFHDIFGWLVARKFALVGIYDILHDEAGRALFDDTLFVRSE